MNLESTRVFAFEVNVICRPINLLLVAQGGPDTTRTTAGRFSQTKKNASLSYNPTVTSKPFCLRQASFFSWSIFKLCFSFQFTDAASGSADGSGSNTDVAPAYENVDKTDSSSGDNGKGAAAAAEASDC